MHIDLLYTVDAETVVPKTVNPAIALLDEIFKGEDGVTCILCGTILTRDQLLADYAPDSGSRSTLDGPAAVFLSDDQANHSTHAICEGCAEAWPEDELVAKVAKGFGIPSYTTNIAASDG